jgi:hypothetical protein
MFHDGGYSSMSNILYSDKLIEISDHSILIRKYYFLFGSKRVDIADIENITAYKPTFLSGKYRYWGTGDFRTWYPPDDRSKRDKIFIMKLKKKWWRIGFTVEDSQTVLNLLKNQCPLTDNSEQE